MTLAALGLHSGKWWRKVPRKNNVVIGSIPGDIPIRGPVRHKFPNIGFPLFPKIEVLEI